MTDETDERGLIILHFMLLKATTRLLAMTTARNSDGAIAAQARALKLSDPDLQKESKLNSVGTNEKRDPPFSLPTVDPKPFRFVPLTLDGNTHFPTTESSKLIEEEVPYKYLKKMTESFYDKAFADATLDQFIRSHEDPHGARFAKWIHQKLSGSNVWDKDRAKRSKEPVEVAGGRYTVVHDRTSAHAAAWHSPKRPRRDVGRRFQLDDCRVWMRLHFWALRESGIMEISPSFADYYVRFIGHFVRVYESSAPIFARDSFRWSAKQENIDRYIKDGRVMKDVLGLSFRKALKQLPDSEANDAEWPYYQTENDAVVQDW